MELDSPPGGFAPSSHLSPISSSSDSVFSVLTDELSRLTSACIEYSRNASEASEQARQREQTYQDLKLRAASLEAALEERNGRIKTAKLETERANAAHDQFVAQFHAMKREADRAYASGQASITAEASSSTSISLESAIKRVVDEVRAVHGESARKAVWSAVLNELRGPEVAGSCTLSLPFPLPYLPVNTHTEQQHGTEVQSGTQGTTR
jgi:chromosome segregation ATPase